MSFDIRSSSARSRANRSDGESRNSTFRRSICALALAMLCSILALEISAGVAILAGASAISVTPIVAVDGLQTRQAKAKIIEPQESLASGAGDQIFIPSRHDPRGRSRRGCARCRSVGHVD